MAEAIVRSPAVGTQARRRRAKTVSPALLAGVALPASGVLIALLALSNPSLEEGIFIGLSLLLVAVLVGGVWIDTRLRGSFDPFSPAAVLTSASLISFSVPGLGLYSDPRGIVPRLGSYFWLNISMAVAVTGIVCLWLGYLLSSRFHASLRTRAVSAAQHHPAQFRLRVAAVLLVVSVVAQLYSISTGQFAYLKTNRIQADLSGFGQLTSYAIWSVYYVILVTGWYVFSGKTNNLTRYLFALATAVGLGTALLSGMKSGVVELLVALTLPYFYARRRIPTRLFVAGFALFVFFYPVNLTYRAIINTGHLNTTSLADAAGAMGSAVATTWGNNSMADTLTFTGQQAKLRQADVLQDIGLIVRYTPQPFPYRMGTAYLQLPATVLIPRIVWPDKPVDSIGYVMTRDYVGFSAYAAQFTSSAPTIFGDLYMNFGIAGVVFGMALLGLLAGLLFSAISPNLSPGRLLYYYVVFLILTNLEGDLNGTIQTIGEALFVIWILNWLMGLNHGSMVPQRLRPSRFSTNRG